MTSNLNDVPRGMLEPEQAVSEIIAAIRARKIFHAFPRKSARHARICAGCRATGETASFATFWGKKGLTACGVATSQSSS